MKGQRSGRIITNVIYFIGAAMVLYLGAMSLTGSDEVIDTMAMIPFTGKERAFIWLALGTVPVLFACMAFYKFNAVKEGTHKIRNFILIFLPGFICAACAIFAVGVVILGMLNSFVLH